MYLKGVVGWTPVKFSNGKPRPNYMPLGALNTLQICNGTESVILLCNYAKLVKPTTSLARSLESWATFYTPYGSGK